MFIEEIFLPGKVGDDLREEQALPMDSALLLCHPAGASNNCHHHHDRDDNDQHDHYHHSGELVIVIQCFELQSFICLD